MTPISHLQALKEIIGELPEGITWERMEAKYMEGVKSHAGEPPLWELPDEWLDREIEEEDMDSIFYKAERQRRKQCAKNGDQLQATQNTL